MVWGSDWPVANLGLGMEGWLDVTLACWAQLVVRRAGRVGWRTRTHLWCEGAGLTGAFGPIYSAACA
jgi:predicted TIM-barrel fold metal-dependent hydrolase